MSNLGTLLHLEGQTIGGCRLIRRLGAGGMGEVYLAEQMRLGNRRVAVKLVRPDDDENQDYRDAARRFLREGRLLAGFSHPNVLPVHDSGVEEGCFYLVMEYAPDGSLKDALNGRGAHPLPTPLDVREAVEIVVQIGAALQYTHDRGIVHGDVKPGNVLVQTDPDGHRRMLLADYGVARDLEATAQLSLVTGTVAYMAPEQFSGGFSPASDQYALAVVAYQLLTGHTPFEGGFAEQMRGHLDLAPTRLRAFNPAVPRSVEAVIGRGLAKDPRARFPSVLAFADALENALRPETDNTTYGTPGAWDATVTLRPALASRRQQVARAHSEQRPPVRMSRTHFPPDSAGHIFFANEAATEQFAGQTLTTRRLDQRRLGIFATCTALLLVALLVAIGTNTAARTRANGSGSQDLASGGQLPGNIMTPVGGKSGTPTASPSVTPNTIENDLAGDVFTVVNVAAPESVSPGQSFSVSITLRNTGQNPWTATDGYRLACDTLHPHSTRSNCPAGFSVALGHAIVRPGSSIMFTLQLKAPTTIGTYNAWLSMAHGTALFSTMPAAISLAVRAPAPTATTQPTNTPAPTVTAQPTPTNTAQPTATPQPTNTPTPQPTNTPTPQPTDTPTPQPTPTETPQPTPTPQPTATDTPEPTATATEAPTPTSTVASTETPTVTDTPTTEPSPTSRGIAILLAM